MTPAKETQARRVLELRRKGLDNEAIAARTGLSRSYITQLLSELSKLEG